MSQASSNSSPAVVLAGINESVAIGRRAIKAIAEQAADSGGVVSEVALTGITATANLTCDRVSLCVAYLAKAAEMGHTVTFGMEPHRELEIAWGRGGVCDVHVADRTGLLPDPMDALALERAISTGNAALILDLLGDRSGRVRIHLHVDGTRGVAWVPQGQLLVDALSGPGWASTLMQLHLDRSAPHLIVLIDDAREGLIQTPTVTFAGPSAELPKRREDLPSVDPESPYRQQKVGEGFLALPEPADLLPTAGASTGLDGLSVALAAVVRALCWYWLAHLTEVQPSATTIRFRGVRDLGLELSPVSSRRGPNVQPEVEFYRWATATTDPARADAVQQAITFAVSRAEDLEQAAEPAQRTAKSLFELASRGLITEALAARRSAREAAATAARGAAASGREVAGKALERGLGLTVAAAVAVFASLQRVLDPRVTAVALVLIAGFLVSALVNALRLDLRSGMGLLDAFNEDLEQYREALSVDDLQSIRNMATLRSARADLDRTRRSVWLVYGIAALLATLMAIFVLSDQAREAVSTEQTKSSIGSVFVNVASV